MIPTMVGSAWSAQRTRTAIIRHMYEAPKLSTKDQFWHWGLQTLLQVCLHFICAYDRQHGQLKIGTFTRKNRHSLRPKMHTSINLALLASLFRNPKFVLIDPRRRQKEWRSRCWDRWWAQICPSRCPWWCGKLTNYAQILCWRLFHSVGQARDRDVELGLHLCEIRVSAVRVGLLVRFLG